MALQKQTKEIALVTGMDSHIEEKALPEPRLIELKNADFSQPGHIQKRFGYDRFGANAYDSQTAATELTQIETMNERLVGFGDQKVFERPIGSTSLRWAKTVQNSDDDENLGALATSFVDRQKFEEANATPFADIAITNGYELLTFRPNVGTLQRAYVREQASGVIVASRLYIGTATIGARAIAHGNILMVIFVSGTTLRVDRINTSDLTSGWTLSTAYSDVHATHKFFDVIFDGTNVIVGYTNTTQLKLAEITSTGSAGSSGTSAGLATQNMAIAHEPTADLYLMAYGETGPNDVNALGWDSSFVAQSTHIVDTGSALSGSIALVRDDTSTCSILWDDGAAPTSIIFKNKSNWDGTSPSAAQDQFHFYRLATKGVRVGDSTYIGVSYDHDTEGHYMIMRWDDTIQDIQEPIARYLHPIGGLEAGQGHLSALVQDGSGNKFKFAIGSKTNIHTDNAVQQFNVVTNVSTFELQKVGAVFDQQMLHLAGGLSAVYGGRRLTVINSPFAPTILSVADAGTSGNLDADAIYQYIAVYETEDENGDVHQSAPSLTVLHDLAAGENETNVAVANTFPRALTEVGTTKIVLYRTQRGPGATFNRLTEITGNHFLSGTVSTTINDTESDASIADNQILYTQSGVLENRPPPPTNVLVEHKNRLWAINAEDGTIWPSKERVAGEGVAFNVALSLEGENEFGRPQALASLDSVMVVFWKKAIGFIYGDGPNDAGVGGQFTTPQILVQSAVGCEAPESIVQTPDGLIFKDPDIGLHILQGTSPPQYIGAPVDSKNGDAVIGTALDSERQTALFMTDAGDALAYHYNVKTWSIHTLASLAVATPTDMTMWDGRPALCDDGGILHRRGTAAFKDSSTTLDLELTTGWIKFDGFQGLARVWDIYLLGNFEEQHTLTVTMSYDYVDTVIDTFVFAQSALTNLDPYQLRMHMRTQQIEAVKLNIIDNGGVEGGGSGHGVSISGLRIVYGVKRRTRIMPAGGVSL